MDVRAADLSPVFDRLVAVERWPCPRQELNLVYDLRKVACGSGTLRGHFILDRILRPGVEPGLAASKTAVRPPHSQRSRSSAPARSRTWSTTFGKSCARPAHSKGAFFILSKGARIRTLCADFGDPLLSQEHTPVSAPALSAALGRCSRPRIERTQAVIRAGSRARNQSQLALRVPDAE